MIEEPLASGEPQTDEPPGRAGITDVTGLTMEEVIKLAAEPGSPMARSMAHALESVSGPIVAIAECSHVTLDGDEV